MLSRKLASRRKRDDQSTIGQLPSEPTNTLLPRIIRLNSYVSFLVPYFHLIGTDAQCAGCPLKCSESLTTNIEGDESYMLPQIQSKPVNTPVTSQNQSKLIKVR